MKTLILGIIFFSSFAYSTSSDVNQLLHETISRGDVETFISIVESERPDIDLNLCIDNKTALMNAAGGLGFSIENKFLEIANYLLSDTKVNINAHCGTETVVTELIGNGTYSESKLDFFKRVLSRPELSLLNTSIEGTHPLIYAAMYDEYSDVVSSLSNRSDVDINAEDFTPARTTALINASAKNTSILLSNPKINVNFKTSDYELNALVQAAVKMDFEKVKLLMVHPGIDVTIKTRGKTALEWALDLNPTNYDVLNYLYKAGVPCRLLICYDYGFKH